MRRAAQLEIPRSAVAPRWPTTRLRALTLTQPWCGLVMSGAKLVENRPRPMIRRDNFNEWFCLHASRELDEDKAAEIIAIAPELQVLPSWTVTSVILGVAAVRDVICIEGAAPEVIENMLALRGYAAQRRFTFGPYVYLLHSEMRPLPEPLPCRGWQGFWTVDPYTDRRVRAAFGGLQ